MKSERSLITSITKYCYYYFDDNTKMGLSRTKLIEEIHAQ
jgi:hypothetical protein